ncbi:MAG: hypothetical protein ACYCZJ_06885 [Sulfuriferula sp.]
MRPAAVRRAARPRAKRQDVSSQASKVEAAPKGSISRSRLGSPTGQPSRDDSADDGG